MGFNVKKVTLDYMVWFKKIKNIVCKNNEHFKSMTTFENVLRLKYIWSIINAF